MSAVADRAVRLYLSASHCRGFEANRLITSDDIFGCYACFPRTHVLISPNSVAITAACTRFAAKSFLAATRRWSCTTPLWTLSDSAISDVVLPLANIVKLQDRRHPAHVPALHPLPRREASCLLRRTYARRYAPASRLGDFNYWARDDPNGFKSHPRPGACSPITVATSKPFCPSSSQVGIAASICSDHRS